MVLDGNSIINRAFFGIRPMATRNGQPTNAVFGFLTTLERLRSEEKPDALCVTFDRHEPTFRHQADAAYKATRHGMPEDLASQMPWMKKILSAMSIPCYEMAGYEADDLIGTISRKCEKAGWECVIVTGDKDSLQLITEHTRVKLITTRMGQTTSRDMTQQAFEAEYGFAPIHMIDLKALMGDSSDNISGVPGIGEKTAMALIQQYQTVDAIYKAMPQVDAKPAALRRLQEGEESARHSYWLATIVTDAPLEFHPEDNLVAPFRPELYDLFLQLEFRKLIEKYGLTPQEDPAVPAEFTATVEILTDPARGEELLGIWRTAGVTVYPLPDLSGLALEHDKDENSSQMTLLFFQRFKGNWNEMLRAIFSGDVPKTAHGVKDLIGQLAQMGIAAEGFVFDTALGAYLLDATAGNYDIAHLFLRYFKGELMAPAHLEEDAFSLLGDTAMAEASMCSFCSAISALREYQEPELHRLGMWELFTQVELPLCPVLADMERIGMKCDGNALQSFSEWLKKEIENCESRIYDQAGETFNINSPKQLGSILFEKLALPHGKKTKTGWSTNAEVLEKLRWEAPVVEDILTFRQYSKLKSTYADGLIKALGPDGRLHTNFQMTVTATGRLSSTEPNLQNIPTRTELGSQIRELFIPESGNQLVDADYSQIELRLLAHMAEDENMLETFRSGEDFHTLTAAKVFHVAPEEVTGELRRRAKAVNFGIVYGISAFSLSQDIGVSVAEAKDYIQRYFETYQGVKNYMTQVVEKAKEQGYVETVMHRRRELPELRSSQFNMRAFGERVALNMPVQGTAADIMKLAMVRVYKRLKKELPEAHLIMQIHDELLVECPQAQTDQAEKILKQEMENVVALRLPLIAEAHSGSNWLAAKG